MDDFVAAPEWTEVRQKSGLDPLGMQAASVRLYQGLIPGISNVTLRARYYGFYAWLAAEYARLSHDPNADSWKRTVRRAEALYALIAARANEDSAQEFGVAGVLWAQRRLSEAGNEAIDFAAHADPGGDDTPYLKQAWGAFGAAYESQLRETGVLGIADAHLISVPTQSLGDEFAQVFAYAAGELGPKLLRTVTAGRVGRRTLSEFAPLLPSRIHPQSQERSAYERMLFAECPSATDGDISRRKSLILALRLAEHLKSDIDAEDMRWILYAGRDWEGNTFEVPEPELSTQRKRWWAYQAGDLGRMAYEGLLKWLLDTLELYPAGLTTDQLVDAAVERLEISNTLWPAMWRGLVEDLPEANNPLSEDEPMSEVALTEEVLEARTDERRAPLRSAQAAIELLAVLCRVCARDREFFADQHGGDQPEAPVRSLATELSFLEGHMDTPLPDLLKFVCKQRILKRHLWVAMRKLQYQRDYTFLVETHDGRLRLRAKDGPVPTNPRLGPALTFLRDIHLIDERGLTKRGKRLASAS